ncbi:hypothetical protein EOD41_07265 [Mucilaginibacter limnophilus]|uniref:Uncharacterized protein n=1 Tax=Mucilaginibacter limnophilus TaxID=1932778 RepID=A0A437MVQ9_9SPHI|nr:DUF5687 family protein [Mucilaginibacter limnophilus]RVU01751.1 hypothetical protein EOD41_07265 [Mucilaginibacter limnophilus]
MTSAFISHELKAFWRSKNTGKSIAIRIVMGILILFLFGYALLLGIVLPKIIEEVSKTDPIISFCGILLVYFLFELLMRLQLQELPTLRVQPYLHLPVKRNALVTYLATTSLLSVFNLWPFLLFWPFIFQVIAPDEGAIVALAFIVSILGFSVFNNYLALYIKRKANLNGWIFLVVVIGLSLITSGDYVWHLYSLRDFSYAFFGKLIHTPAYALIPVVLALGMYYLNFVYLKQNLYLEDLNSSKKSSFKSSTDYPVLQRFGTVGDLVANEVKLIMRNKRPRSTIIMGLMFMFYGLIFYTNPKLGTSDYSAIFVGVFMTGIFIINYGQFMHSWQASHFDGLLVSRINFTDFIKAKFLLFTMVSTVAFVLTIPYVYFGWRILIIHFVMYVYNLGVNTAIMLFFANRNYKRIDLSKGASFNWEGVGATQLLVGFPLLLIPFIIYAPFRFFGVANAGLVALALIGIAGIALRQVILKGLVDDFNTKKLQIAEGFRNK